MDVEPEYQFNFYNEKENTLTNSNNDFNELLQNKQCEEVKNKEIEKIINDVKNEGLGKISNEQQKKIIELTNENIKQQNENIKQNEIDDLRKNNKHIKILDFVPKHQKRHIALFDFDYLSYFNTISNIVNYKNDKYETCISYDSFINILNVSIELAEKLNYLEDIREDEVNELNEYEDNQCDIMDTLDIEYENEADLKYFPIIIEKIKELQNQIKNKNDNDKYFNLPLDNNI